MTGLVLQPYRIYLIGAVLGLSSVLLVLFSQESKCSRILALMSGVAFAIGFATWIGSQLRRLWRSFAGKLAVAVLHSFVLLLSIIPARFLVAEGLGLPPQDFEVTVAMTVVALYLPVWLLVIAVLMLLIYVITLCLILLLSIVQLGSEFFFMHMRLITGRVAPMQSSLGHLLSRILSAGLAHGIGAAAVAVIAVATWDWTFAEMRSVGRPIVRLVAYFADFQRAPLYPGVEPSKRLRLHENGVVSYAERRGSEIVIAVGKLK